MYNAFSVCCLHDIYSLFLTINNIDNSLSIAG